MWHPDMGTLAQVIGEQPYESPAFVPGVDFDPYDPDEVEIVQAATEGHRAETIERQRREISRLQSIIDDLTEESDG